jgi:hypothetical protein
MGTHGRQHFNPIRPKVGGLPNWPVDGIARANVRETGTVLGWAD